MSEQIDVIVQNPLSHCLICLERGGIHIPFPCRCSGRFHKSCLDKWYNESASCPICRVQVYPIPPRIYIELRPSVNSIIYYLSLCMGMGALLIGIGIPAGIMYLIITHK